MVLTSHYSSLEKPTTYAACHPGKTTTCILHLVRVTRHTHVRHKSQLENKTKKRLQVPGTGHVLQYSSSNSRSKGTVTDLQPQQGHTLPIARVIGAPAHRLTRITLGVSTHGLRRYSISQILDDILLPPDLLAAASSIPGICCCSVTTKQWDWRPVWVPDRCFAGKS